ncbi:GGDEF domain-containing protein [Rhizobium sp. SL86]|uniref:GGDEF domain-containing protein n=1 Tax=Rhizobium sp. SL86 TaxID=2995148 RepID=UPI0022735DDE|nr:GGDEF domain-containing protein [Rhizobium sp. SL86]MCY1667579.1 GGDEF domain-containing protein [Rhizobium sp. SL86]
MLFKRLTTVLVGANEPGYQPPWGLMQDYYMISPHFFAAMGILAAAVQPLSQGETGKVLLIAGMLAFQLIVCIICQYRFERRSDNSRFESWLNGYIGILCLSGLTWGGSLALLYVGASPDSQLFTLAVCFAIVQSCISRIYMTPGPTLGLILVIATPLVLAALSEDQWTIFPLAVIFFMFQMSHMLRLISFEEGRNSAERQMVRLMAELTEANAQLLRHAATDGLTGLANRRVLDSDLKTAISAAKSSHEPLCVILLDVDHFKSFNDNYGHLSGDECLCRIGRMLAGESAGGSIMPARYGGEEFAIILRGLNREKCLNFATGLLEKAAALDMSDIATPGTTITISIGLATFNAATDDELSLLDRADKGLYAAKHAGRNCVRTIESSPRQLSVVTR